jgi:hypothetical protein
MIKNSDPVEVNLTNWRRKYCFIPFALKKQFLYVLLSWTQKYQKVKDGMIAPRIYSRTYLFFQGCS